MQDNLSRALIEFKRDKVNKQNARLSLVNSVYENPSMPQRKIMLSVGANNYRPPLERSKSAPRLMAIDEAAEDEDDEDGGYVAEKKHTIESRPCCTVDPLYPAMTLGRRRCKRGHSIRRTGMKPTKIPNNAVTAATIDAAPDTINDDLDKLLLRNNYDTPLEGELMTYLDNRLKMKTTSMLDLHPEFMYEPDSMKTALSLDDLDRYSDVEEEEEEGREDEDDTTNESHDDRVQYFVSNKPLELTSVTVSTTNGGRTKLNKSSDSDESSLSSGCESVSTVTTSIEVQVEASLGKIDGSTDKNANHLNDGGSDECSNLLMNKTMPKMMATMTIICNGHHRERSSDSESEFSDESGYVEYKENAQYKQIDILNNNNNNNCNVRSEL